MIQIEDKHKIFLNTIRDSGAINPLAAGPYLQEEFGLSRIEAKRVIRQWMQSFSAKEEV
jgi:hypothetical protein